jgi:Mg-chelatase subunit ChlD
MKPIDMNLRKWYGTSVTIPTYNSTRFPGFVASCIGIVTSIFRDKVGQRVRVRFTQDGTASADMDENIINLNGAFLRGEVKGVRKEELKSDEAISLLLGLIVHEAAHFAYSPRTLTPYADYIKARTKCKFIKNAALALGNVIEDIFIEAEVDRRVPSLTWMLNCTNEIFFDPMGDTAVLDKVQDVHSAPANLKGVTAVLDAVLLAKIREEISSTPYIELLFASARGATEAMSHEVRFQLALEIYDMVMAEIKEEDKEGEGAGIDDVVEKAKGPGGSYENGDKPGRARRMGHAAEAKAAETSWLLEAIEDDEVSMEKTPHHEDGVAETTMVYVEREMAEGAALESDLRYARLAEVARQRSSVNRPYGLDKKSGHSIRKLYRIATDQKIFAESQPMSNYSPMEVLILVDCSGSMTMGTGRLRSRMLDAAEAALGAAEGLTEGRCKVAVYGHTSHVHSMNELVIYRAKGFNEPINNLAQRLGYMVRDVAHSQNMDGYAVKWIARKFQGNSKKKLLIVISDGEPAAPNYGGEEAIQHSKRCADEVRALGIDVLSISITRQADMANNIIYGAQHNVYNQDPNVIEDVVRKLITQ